MVTEPVCTGVKEMILSVPDCTVIVARLVLLMLQVPPEGIVGASE